MKAEDGTGGKIAQAKNLKRPEGFQATNFQDFQPFLREIQSRNLQEPEKSELSKALLREAKQLFNLPARAITAQTGLASVKSVIQKTRHPTTKSMLIRKLGWRLVETEQGQQTRLETLLKNLLSKSYNSAGELLTELKTLL